MRPQVVNHYLGIILSQHGEILQSGAILIVNNIENSWPRALPLE